MYKFSKASLSRLDSVDRRIKDIMLRSIKYSPIDFGIPSDGGLRTPEEQYALFKAGKSKCDGDSVMSKHQSGKAIDVFAYLNGAANWEKEYYFILCGVIMSSAKSLGHELRWGGDFNMNWDLTDDGFMDYVHFEIIE